MEEYNRQIVIAFCILLFSGFGSLLILLLTNSSVIAFLTLGFSVVSSVVGWLIVDDDVEEEVKEYY